MDARLRAESDVVRRHHGHVGESLLTADEVADLLGVPASWVYAQSRAGRLPTVTLGRYRREAIEGWIASLEAEGVDGRARRRAA